MDPNQSEQSTFARLDLTSLTPSLVGGLVSGFYVAIFMFAYASLIFTGELTPFLPNGIGALLFGAIAIGLVMALTSAIPSVIASPNDYHAESVVIDEVSTYYRLSSEALGRLKENDSQVAVKFQEFLLSYLAIQYTRNAELLKDILALEE